MRALAATAKSAFIPQCGLAPGFITIVGYDLARKFDGCRTRRASARRSTPRMRSTTTSPGARTASSTSTASPAGDLNGELVAVSALEEREGSRSMASPTKPSTPPVVSVRCASAARKSPQPELPHHPLPRARCHHEGAAQDLRLGRREVLKDILEHALPTTPQDVVIVFVTVTGKKKVNCRKPTPTRSMASQSTAWAQRHQVTGRGHLRGAGPARRAPATAAGVPASGRRALAGVSRQSFGKIYAPRQRPSFEACAA